MSPFLSHTGVHALTFPLPVVTTFSSRKSAPKLARVFFGIDRVEDRIRGENGCRRISKITFWCLFHGPCSLMCPFSSLDYPYLQAQSGGLLLLCHFAARYALPEKVFSQIISLTCDSFPAQPDAREAVFVALGHEERTQPFGGALQPH